jgi:hypothetical protein
MNFRFCDITAATTPRLLFTTHTQQHNYEVGPIPAKAPSRECNFGIKEWDSHTRDCRGCGCDHELSLEKSGHYRVRCYVGWLVGYGCLSVCLARVHHAKKRYSCSVTTLFVCIDVSCETHRVCDCRFTLALFFTNYFCAMFITPQNTHTRTHIVAARIPSRAPR